MKCISWNVNGLRACLKKGFMESFVKLDADIFALQETKMQPEQAILDLPGYKQYWNSAERKGYSGTAVFSRIEPLSVTYGLGIEEHDHEGRVITLELPDCYFVTVYTPNSKRGLERLAYRMEWEDAFRAYLVTLDAKKPVIVCGDFNVAHAEIDLKNPKTNHRNAGFIDTFRALYPDRVGIYTWWSYLRKARETNAGWRIDYFVTSARLREKSADATIHNEIFGSDHCPVGLELKA